MQPRVFYPQLESLRGLAAFIVLLHHAIPISINDPALSNALFSLAMAWGFVFHGGAAVILFFVLSGFVMGLNVDLTNGLSVGQYCEFLLRRVFRLYPVVFVSIISSLLIRWYGFGEHFSPSQVLNFFSLVDISINPPLWSIQVEAVVSAIYPILLFIVIRGGNAARGLILPVTIILYFLGYGPQLVLPHLSAFVLGLLVPYLGKELMTGLGGRWSTILLPFVFCAYSSGNVIGYYQLLPPSPPIFLQAFGAFYIVAFVTYRCQDYDWLKTGLARWLGRISYSLYAMHFWVVLAISSHFAAQPPWLRLFSTLIVGVPASLLVGALVAHTVEWPFQRLGRKFSEFGGIGLTSKRRLPEMDTQKHANSRQPA
jgi:peptidoglycan/LPS O-acetylase OafA/YrhL